MTIMQKSSRKRGSNGIAPSFEFRASSKQVLLARSSQLIARRRHLFRWTADTLLTCLLGGLFLCLARVALPLAGSIDLLGYYLDRLSCEKIPTRAS